MTKLITPKELAERWGMSADTLKKWRCVKKGPPFIKLGGKDKEGRDSIRYRLDDIVSYENKNEVAK
jgi:Helix-turn-helix domain